MLVRAAEHSRRLRVRRRIAQPAKRRKRQTAYDDFLSAAEWLIARGRTIRPNSRSSEAPCSDCSVAAASTLAARVVSRGLLMVPLADMLQAHPPVRPVRTSGSDEFGTADDAGRTLPLSSVIRPIIRVARRTSLSRDDDRFGRRRWQLQPAARPQNDGSLAGSESLKSSRVARLQHSRGHSPVLPLSERINALTDRMAFLCDQLELPI